jgi:hypothetical protein
MREEFVTPVRRALPQSLPPAVQKRCLQDLKSAEHFEAALKRVIELLFRRPVHGPVPASRRKRGLTRPPEARARGAVARPR